MNSLPSPKTLCLNMIVKNESRIILRLLESVYTIIDTYCISDTGSTDNTVELIEQFFKEKNIPGKISHVPFVNFEFNRTYALKNCLGMSDYILLMDADMVLINNGFDKSLLTDDVYYLYQGHKETYYYGNIRIVRNVSQISYKGVTHEYVECMPNAKISKIDKDILFILDISDGGCKSNKFERDIDLLTKGLEADPTNSRYMFYLANSYHDIGRYEECIEHYKKRISMGGWIQEQWYSYYRIGLAYKKMANMKNDADESRALYRQAISYWLEGFEIMPTRIENIYEIVQYYRIQSKQKTALAFYYMAKNAMQQPNVLKEKDDFLFLLNDIYTYKLDYEYSIIGFYSGIKEMNDTWIRILNVCNDQNILNCCYKNMKFYKNVLKPIVVSSPFSSLYTSNEKKIEYQSSSSSLIPCEDGYIMNIMNIPCTIDENGTYSFQNDRLVIMNKRNVGSKSLNEMEEKEESMIELPIQSAVKNMRIMSIDKSIILTWNSIDENGKIKMWMGTNNHRVLDMKEITCAFQENPFEKWVLLPFSLNKNSNEICFIRKFYPLEICVLNQETNCIEKRMTKEMPLFFKNMRGSTHGVLYQDELWFCLHFVSDEPPYRHSYHIFLKMDKQWNILSYSAPFKMEGEPVEYCLGLVVEEDRVVMTYSTMDRVSKIAIYDKKSIDALCCYK